MGANNISNNGSIFTENIRINSQQSQEQSQLREETDLQALEELERAVLQLEGNIVDVNDIFNRLAAIVYEQEETVDSIEQLVEQSRSFVSQGTQNFYKGNSQQTKHGLLDKVLQHMNKLGAFSISLLAAVLVIAFC